MDKANKEDKIIYIKATGRMAKWTGLENVHTIMMIIRVVRSLILANSKITKNMDMANIAGQMAASIKDYGKME